MTRLIAPDSLDAVRTAFERPDAPLRSKLVSGEEYASMRAALTGQVAAERHVEQLTALVEMTAGTLENLAATIPLYPDLAAGIAEAAARQVRHAVALIGVVL